MQLTISNSQKQVPIKLNQFKEMVKKLALQVCQDLNERLPAHISQSQLKAIETYGELSVSLVSSQKITSLNRVWRNKYKATDVLSFSLAVEDPEYFDLITRLDMPIELGEVIISAPKARIQAIDYGHSLERELYFLFVHGFLHVLGFDHLKASEEKEMFRRQRAVLSALSVTR